MNKTAYVISYSPVWFIMFFTYAFQDNVGTDYLSYVKIVKIFSESLQVKEKIFAFIVYVAHILDNPQLLFIILSLIQVSLIIIIIWTLSKRGYDISSYILLYICLSSSYFNYLNNIRQLTAAEFLFFAFLKLQDDNIKAALLFSILAIGFHMSAYFFIIILILYKFFLTNRIFNLNLRRALLISIILTIVLTYVDTPTIIRNIATYMGGVFKNYVDRYSISFSYVRMETKVIIAKLLKAFVLIYSMLRLNEKNLTNNEKKILLFSLISLPLYFLAFNSMLISRLYVYFDFFFIFPTVLFFKYNAKYEERLLIDVYLFLFVMGKCLIFPDKEYLWKCILF